MINISGRAMRAGTRGIAVLAAVAGFAVLPQLTHDGPARADGSGGPARHHHPDGEHRDRPRGSLDHPRGGHRDTPGASSEHPGGEHLGRPGVSFGASAPHGKIVPGRTYKWPYSVTNHGRNPARNVTLETTPDRDLKVVTTPPRCAWRRASVLVCRVGLIPRGRTRRGSITATVNPRAQVGKSLASPARLSWQSAPVADERTTTAAFPPVSVSPVTDLRVTSTAPDQAGPSDAPYRIAVTNDGPVTAESVVVRAAVAPQLSSERCAAGGCARPRSDERCAFGSCAPRRADACGTRCARVNTAACRTGCAAGRTPACGTGCAGQRPGDVACGSGSCGIPSCGCRPVRPVEQAAPPSDDRCGGQVPCGSCAPCSAARPPASDRRAESCGGDRASCGVPVAGSGAANHPPRVAPVSISHHRRCVAEGTGFVCPLGTIPPGRTRTLRLGVHGRPGAPARRFRCLSTVRSGTPDSNMANNRSACHTRLARPLPVRASAPKASVPTRRLPVTGGPFDVLALWGLGLAGVGLALFGAGRLRRGEQG